MNFQPELAAKVMDGSKTVTRRIVSDNPRSPWWREHCSLVVGKDYAVCPGRGKNQIGRVRVVSVERMGLWPMTDSEAKAEGFVSLGAFANAWDRINKHALAQHEGLARRVRGGTRRTKVLASRSLPDPIQGGTPDGRSTINEDNPLLRSRDL